MLFYEIDSTCCMHDCTCYLNLEQCSLLVNYGKFALHDFENYNTCIFYKIRETIMLYIQE